MYQTFIQFAVTEAPAKKADLFGSLGIDWTLLVIQTVAFLVLMWFLGKYVYPALSKSLDKREADIEAANKAAVETAKNAEKTQAEIREMLTEARKEAGEIVATAKEEASSMVTTAEEKSKTQAERIVAQAHESIAKEVVAAKRDLHNETIELVALATEKVLGKSVDANIDKKLIKSAIEESK